MAEEVETETTDTADDATTEDSTTEETTDDTATEETAEVEEPNYAAQLKDLTDRFNVQADQIEVLIQRVADLENENADLVESIVTDEPNVTDSHDATGDEFYDELFV